MVWHCCVFCSGGCLDRSLWHRLGCICYTYAQSVCTCASSGTLAQSRLYHTHDSWHTYQGIHEELEPVSSCKIRISFLLCLLASTGLTWEHQACFPCLPCLPMYFLSSVSSLSLLECLPRLQQLSEWKGKFTFTDSQIYIQDTRQSWSNQLDLFQLFCPQASWIYKLNY